MYCEACGSKLIEGDIFCGECGHKVTVEDDKTTPIPQASDKPILDITAPMDSVKTENKPAESMVPIYKHDKNETWTEKEAKPVKTVKEKKVKQKKVKEKKKFDGRNVVIIILIIALLAGLVSAFLGVIPTAKQLGLPFADKLSVGSASKYEGNGYNSPEDAVEAYITAINNGDMDGVISTFAIESYVDNYDTEANLNRSKGFVPTSADSQIFSFKENDAFSRDIGIAQRRGTIASYIYKQVMNITLYEIGYDPSLVTSFADEDEVSDFVDAIKEASTYEDWKSMEFVEFVEPEDIFDSWSKDRENQIKDFEKIQKKIFGAEDVKYVTAVIEAGGDEYYQLFTCVEYNGKWYNAHLYSIIGGIAGLSLETQGMCPVDDLN